MLLIWLIFAQELVILVSGAVGIDFFTLKARFALFLPKYDVRWCKERNGAERALTYDEIRKYILFESTLRVISSQNYQLQIKKWREACFDWWMNSKEQLLWKHASRHLLKNMIDNNVRNGVRRALTDDRILSNSIFESTLRAISLPNMINNKLWNGVKRDLIDN